MENTGGTKIKTQNFPRKEHQNDINQKQHLLYLDSIYVVGSEAEIIKADNKGRNMLHRVAMSHNHQTLERILCMKLAIINFISLIA